MEDKKKDGFWKTFEKTGDIGAYLNYACASERTQILGKEEGNIRVNTGNSNRYCAISNANR